ncbi:MAG: hypothetical protein JXR97_01565 [Planctomycetes bacterium]|nr:hypothetical protein [Planctomycetota bacterium]
MEDGNMRDMGSGFAFRKFGWRRHGVVLAAMIVLCAALYGRAVNVDMQFDDIPNIKTCQAVMMENFTASELWRAIKYSTSPNRVLVSASFAVQHWAAKYLPRLIDVKSSVPDFVPWQLRLFNYIIHIAAGFVVYLLFLRLLQLPQTEKHFSRRAWEIAFVVSIIWFCSPVQTQAVTYIVQRATSMAALFYCAALVAYLEARAGDGWGRRLLFFGLSIFLGACAIFSKELSVTIIAAVPILEFVLIWNGLPAFLCKRFFGDRDKIDAGERKKAIASAGWILAAVLAFSAVSAVGVSWFFGVKKGAAELTKENISKKFGESEDVVSGEVKRSAFAKLSDQLFRWVIEDNEKGSTKVWMTPRQRLLTELRVVAMYEGLLLVPAHTRLTLDYDFVESKGLLIPEQYRGARQLFPLILIILIAVCVAFSPARWRAAVFLAIVFLLSITDALNGLGCDARPPGLADVWLAPWPVPALVMHLFLLGFCAFYCYRRPLLVFGILFFYLGHVVESSVIMLEVVFEHRMYLPSVGLYLAVGLLLFEVFCPPRENDLGPRLRSSGDV